MSIILTTARLPKLTMDEVMVIVADIGTRARRVPEIEAGEPEVMTLIRPCRDAGGAAGVGHVE